MGMTTFRLDYILAMANNMEFDNDNVHISRVIYDHYDKLADYSLNTLLEYLNVSKQAFKKYYLEVGFANYTEFKDESIFASILRMKQVKRRIALFDQDKMIKLMSEIKGSSIDMETIDNICHQIHQSDKVIFYGSPTLLNKIFDFQIDMKLFHKTVFISSINKNKIITPNDNDLLCICSATGRLFSSCDAQFKEKVLDSNNKKVLFTQNKLVNSNVDYVLETNTVNDYFEMHYLYMFYLDLIEVRYYELYVKDGNQ